MKNIFCFCVVLFYVTRLVVSSVVTNQESCLACANDPSTMVKVTPDGLLDCVTRDYSYTGVTRTDPCLVFGYISCSYSVDSGGMTLSYQQDSEMSPTVCSILCHNFTYTYAYVRNGYCGCVNGSSPYSYDYCSYQSYSPCPQQYSMSNSVLNCNWQYYALYLAQSPRFQLPSSYSAVDPPVSSWNEIVVPEYSPSIYNSYNLLQSFSPTGNTGTVSYRGCFPFLSLDTLNLPHSDMYGITLIMDMRNPTQEPFARTKCYGFCNSKSYTSFGLSSHPIDSDAIVCSCSNSYGFLGRVSDDNCPLDTNSNSNVGSVWYNAVYQIKDTKKQYAIPLQLYATSPLQVEAAFDSRTTIFDSSVTINLEKKYYYVTEVSFTSPNTDPVLFYDNGTQSSVPTLFNSVILEGQVDRLIARGFYFGNKPLFTLQMLGQTVFPGETLQSLTLGDVSLTLSLINEDPSDPYTFVSLPPYFADQKITASNPISFNFPLQSSKPKPISIKVSRSSVPSYNVVFNIVKIDVNILWTSGAIEGSIKVPVPLPASINNKAYFYLTSLYEKDIGIGGTTLPKDYGPFSVTAISLPTLQKGISVKVDVEFHPPDGFSGGTIVGPIYVGPIQLMVSYNYGPKNSGTDAFVVATNSPNQVSGTSVVSVSVGDPSQISVTKNPAGNAESASTQGSNMQVNQPWSSGLVVSYNFFVVLLCFGAFFF